MNETESLPPRSSIPEANKRGASERASQRDRGNDSYTKAEYLLSNEATSSQHVDPEKHADFEKVATSKDTSSSTSPCPSVHESEVDGQTVVSFDEHDRTNPYNWSMSKKLYVVITGMLMVLNSTLGSALPSGATRVFQKYFDVKSEELLVLPVSIYLIGYILGPLIFAPLSESYGRKIIMVRIY